MFKRLITTLTAILFCLCLSLQSIALDVPYTFVNGQVADANQVNLNFATIYDDYTTFLTSYNATVSVVATDYNSGALTSATIQEAIDDIGSALKSLYISSGTWAITTSTTIPENIDIIIAKGAKFDVSTGVVLTINGMIHAGLSEIFIGDGTEVLGENSCQEIPVQWYGAKIDNTTDDSDATDEAIVTAYNSSVKKVRLGNGTSFAGNIVLKSGVAIEGYGPDRSILDMKGTYFTGIRTEDVTETDLTAAFVNPIVKGTITNTIANTASAGDFITFKDESTLFTSLWSASVIRSYYYMGEMFKIKTAGAGSVTFDESPALNISEAGTQICESFTPNKNMAIKNLSITKDVSTSTSYGLRITQSDDVTIDNVKIENTNKAIIEIDKSMNVNISNVVGKGDLDNDCYGIQIINGSKHVNINNYIGSKFQHAIDAGGNGYAVPMYVNASNMVVTDTLTNALSLHTHGLSAFFNYSNAQVDSGIDMSGLGHKANNIHSTGGSLYHYEGGIGITYNDITIDSCYARYTSEPIINSVYNNIDLTFKSGFNRNVINASSLNNTYNNIRFVNSTPTTVYYICVI